MEEMTPETYAECAYELYKLNWKQVNLWNSAEKDVIIEYYTDTDSEYREEYSLNDYIEENGYGGSLYVCFDEFMGAEFLNRGFMKSLMLGTDLFDMYDEMLKALKEKEEKDD